MKMTPARPPSPNSLLWAHQLKREHGHLLARVKQLESATEEHDKRLRTAESTAAPGANDEIAALADQVKALHRGHLEKRLDMIEKDVMSKIEEAKIDSEAVALKMAQIEKNEALVEEERRKAFNKEKALLKRVGECEENLKKYETFLDQVGKKVDSASIAQIRSQLDSLAQQVKSGGSEMKLMSDSIMSLELANAELIKANERLAAEFAQLKAKAAESASVPSPLNGKKSRRKPHRWSGGGADRDIIRQGSDVSVGSSSKQKPKLHRRAGGTADDTLASPGRGSLRQKKATPKAAAKESAIAVTKSIATTKATTARGNATLSASSGKPKKADKAAAQLAKYTTAADADKTVVRAGKGWIEFAYAAEEDEEESDSPETTIKRPPGRPRKEDSLKTFDGLDVGPRTRRSTSRYGDQSAHTQVVSKKRKADEDCETPKQSTKTSAATGGMKIAQTDVAKRIKVDKTPAVFDSPASSSANRSSHKGADTKQPSTALLGSRTAPSDPPVPNRRRVIEQFDELL